MIKAIAVDDEKNALGIIKEFCSKIPDVTLEETFTDPLKALPFISKNPQINVAFLDIQMTRLNGLVLANQLRDKSINIILTTAYPDYALQGYDMDVVDYLLKPFSFERFERCILKAKTIFGIRNELIDKVSNKLSASADDFIFVKADYKTVKIKIIDILFIEGSSNYVTLHTTKSKILVFQSMKTFEDQLLPYQFIRIHKSFIISLPHIDIIDKNLVKIGSAEIPIGESYKGAFQKFLKINYKQF